jgi:hypothetical protein
MSILPLSFNKDKTLSNTYDFTNIKSFENTYLINNVLDLMLIKRNIVLVFGKFKCYRNKDKIYNNKLIKSFTIEYNNILILDMISDSDIFFIFYVWLKFNKKNKYMIHNIIIKNAYHDWVQNVITNYDF